MGQQAACKGASWVSWMSSGVQDLGLENLDVGRRRWASEEDHEVASRASSRWHDESVAVQKRGCASERLASMMVVVDERLVVNSERVQDGGIRQVEDVLQSDLEEVDRPLRTWPNWLDRNQMIRLRNRCSPVEARVERLDAGRVPSRAAPVRLVGWVVGKRVAPDLA